MPGVKDVVIFIVNYNGVTLLKDLFYKCLDSFIRELESSSSVDLWFVDNGSTDSSLEKVKARYRNKLRYLRLSRNLGYGAACNIAYKYTKRLGLQYKYYVCSNNDIEVYPGKLKELLRWLNTTEKKYPKGFIMTPLLINGYDGFIDFGGFFVDEAGGTWSLRLVLLNRDRVDTILKKPILVSYSDGAFLIVHQRVIEDVGWFDPQLFLYYDDVELSLRAWSCGYPSLLVPVVLGIHYRSLTTKKMNVIPIYLGVRNKVYSIARYIGTISILKLMSWYLSYIIRIPETRNTQLGDTIRRIIPGHIAYEPGNVSLVNLSKFILRAFIDGFIMAMNKQRKYHRKLIDISPLFRVGLTDMFSQKNIIAKIQSQIKQYLIHVLSSEIRKLK